MRSEDIAKLVGVSRSTVSRVLNNYPDIPEATREKVLKAIKEYNYFPNASARRLAGKKSKTLGVFMVDVRSDEHPHHLKLGNEYLLYNNTYFAPFINAFIDQANKMDYFVLVSTVYNSDDLKKVQSAFHEKRIDGGVFIGSSETDNPYIFESIGKSQIFAMIDAEANSIYERKAVYVNVNNYQGAFEAVRYFVQLGHRNIGIITGNLSKFSGLKRFDGFKQALAKFELPLEDANVGFGDFTEPSGYNAMKKLMNLANRPSAVFISNDTMAVGAYKAAAEMGIGIPKDISIIGFDDIQSSAYMSPPLTTIHVSLHDIAKNTAEFLIDAIEKEKQPAIQKLIDTRLVIRDSCRTIK